MTTSQLMRSSSTSDYRWMYRTLLVEAFFSDTSTLLTVLLLLAEIDELFDCTLDFDILETKPWT